MTECERLVSEGIFQTSFFKSETRSEFFITENRKKIWAIELDLLLKFDSVCKKNNFKYFLMYGSLLGAIRHKGFIPWDDDLDVVMFREDYNKLLELSDDFEDPYFLQTPGTDKGYYFSFAKLRNSNTTALSKMFIYETFNQGMFLDIFPLDNFVDINSQKRFDEILYLNKENSTYMRMNNKELGEEDKKRVMSYSGKIPMVTYNEIQSIASMYNNVATEYCSNSVFTLYPLSKSIFFKNDFEILYFDFEGLSVPIPKGYDRILKTIYGDYFQLPPIEKRGLWHDGVIFDADKPYTEYLK